MRLSDEGVALLKEYEGFSATAYRCPAGKLTAGYGHVLLAGEAQECPLTEAKAEAWLRRDVEKIEKTLENMVLLPLAQGQWDAVVCLAYNIGCAALSKSTLLRKINAGDVSGAAGEFERWIFAGGRVLPGLVRRRQAEKQLFMTAKAMA